MRRLFWLAAGVGAGVAGAVLTSRWARRQAERMAPARLARRAGGGLVELGKLVAESLEEGRRAMREAEEEARRRLEEERQAARG
ncbi:MAG TPA: hypothetical protein VNP94_09965 [Actinomycetota bacterium]|nr:hypothetical protein [Actinomycetota bacterium]